MKLAEIRWKEIVKEILAQHPHGRLRIVSDLDAICLVCKAELTYRSRTRDLVLRTPWANNQSEQEKVFDDD